MRLARVLAPLAVAASLALPQTGAHAAQTLTYTFPVLCSDADGAASNDLADITLPSGTYAVTVAGACTVGHLGYGTTAGTPCTAPVAGAIPCASATAGNLPNGLCHTSIGGVSTDCGPSPAVRVTGCGMYSVVVAGDCVSTPQAGLVYHDGGTMTARFVDTVYGDNAGALLVTVVFTPL